MSISWSFYSRRRSISLDRFLSGVRTLDDALEKFETRGILPPDDLAQFFESKKPAQKARVRRSKQKEPAASERAKLKTEEKNENKEYFRKVIKKEKSKD